MKIDVLILYEHVQRELKNACILKVLLEREGYSVRIGNVAWRKGLLNLKYRPRLIVSPSCQNDLGVNYIIHNYIGAYNGGYKILNLYSEQLTSSSAISLLSVKEAALNIYHCAWGRVTYDNLLKTGIDEKQIRITGSQRLDYTKKIFKNFNISKAELSKRYGLDINKKWILMVGNFPVKDETKFRYLDNAGYNNLVELHDLTIKTYSELLNWYKNIIENPSLKDNIEFIYRPHPNELIENDLVNLTNEHNNFHIIGDLTISDWAINIDLAYIWTSTSSIEISAANVPIVSLMPYKLKPYFEMMLVEYIEKIQSVDDLVNITNDILFNGQTDINKEFKEQISNYYQITDISASENIVKFIKQIMSNDKNIIMSSFSIFKGVAKTFVYFCEYILYRLNISTNKYLKIRFRDYRTDKFIDEYSKEIGDKIFG